MCSQYLLSKKGYDTEKLQVKLSRVELKDSFEPIEPLHETDLEGYLQHEHEMLLLTAIEEAKKEVCVTWNSHSKCCSTFASLPLPISFGDGTISSFFGCAVVFYLMY